MADITFASKALGLFCFNFGFMGCHFGDITALGCLMLDALLYRFFDFIVILTLICGKNPF